MSVLWTGIVENLQPTYLGEGADTDSTEDDGFIISVAEAASRKREADLMSGAAEVALGNFQDEVLQLLNDIEQIDFSRPISEFDQGVMRTVLSTISAANEHFFGHPDLQANYKEGCRLLSEAFTNKVSKDMGADYPPAWAFSHVDRALGHECLKRKGPTAFLRVQFA